MQSSRNVFTTVRTEGLLLPPDLLRRIAEADPTLGGLGPSDYHLTGERINEATNRAWNRLCAAWRSFRDATERLPESETGTSLTRERWLLPLFDSLGYGRLQTSKAVELGNRSFAVSHSWGHVPIHLVGFRVDIGKRSAGVAGASKTSPHGLVQDLLNRSDERLWGIVSNGLKIRLLRDSASFVRQAFVEFDLEAMFDGEIYADFALLWLLCHQSRVESDKPEDCWLERWSHLAAEQGTRALDRFRGGVQRAIVSLGTGFLQHKKNNDLRSRLHSGELAREEYYRQLLRVVYRLLFLQVAEERNLLHLPSASEKAIAVYKQCYSMNGIRALAERRRGSPHSDVWLRLKVVWDEVAKEEGFGVIGLPSLTGFLWRPESIGILGQCAIANSDVLQAVRELSFFTEDGIPRPVDFRSMGSEELGSVYEALLELHPEVNVEARAFDLTTTGDERHATGSHYTPPAILRRVLDFALSPRIQKCLESTNPESALLDLRILDPACGSGHFLIAAGHRVAQALASARTGDVEPAPDQVSHAFRDVVARCLYGVDINPMAVELCKIALWLETLEPGKPLGFLDHHIQCGNSLVGVPLGATVARNRARVAFRKREIQAEIDSFLRKARDLTSIESAEDAGASAEALRRELEDCVYDSWADAVPDEAFKPVAPTDNKAFGRAVASQNRKSRKSDGQLEIGHDNVTVVLPADLVETLNDLGAGAEDNTAEVTIRANAYESVMQRLEYRHAIELANTWTSAWFWPLQKDVPPPPTHGTFITLKRYPNSLQPLVLQEVLKWRREKRFFHYELAYPEVFTKARGGFDLVIGNPPYLGGMKISGTYGEKTLHFLKQNHAEQTGGRSDLAAYFLRRGFDLLRPSGDLCFITTKTIAQGDTRDAGLGPILRSWGGEIANAVRSEPWPGEATVDVSVIHLHNGSWGSPRTLDGESVVRITADLSSGEDANPRHLSANREIAFAGTNILGEGFQVSSAERAALIGEDPRSEAVLRPFVGGAEVMASVDPGPQRWIIDFGARSLEEASRFVGVMEIVRARVKPNRDRAKEKRVREKWWKFGRPGANLYSVIAHRRLERVIVIPEVSKTMLPVFLKTGAVFAHTLFMFADDSHQLFGELSSSFHWLWAASRCTSMRTDPRYNPSLCFMTFARPEASAEVAEAGEAIANQQGEVRTDLGIGTTKAYNLVNDPSCDTSHARELRRCHIALDHAMARAYGWHDLVGGLQHGHHPTRFGVRWTLSPSMQVTVLKRLLELNLERSARDTSPPPVDEWSDDGTEDPITDAENLPL